MGADYRFLEQLEQLFTTAIKNLGWQLPSDLNFGPPPRGIGGDLATSCALVIAAEVKLPPREVATQIIAKLGDQTGLLQHLNIAGPGFINFDLGPSAWDEILNNALATPETAGESGRRVVVDYSGPNIGKPFSVGHLRSTVIGDAVVKLHQAESDYVIKVNHLGDWGTQFGKLILAVDKWGSAEQISSNPTYELQQLYVRFHHEAEEDPSLDDRAREWFKRLEDGEPEAKQKWQQLIDWSLPEYDRIYELLGVSFSDPNVPESGVKGESFYTKEMLEAVLAELRAKDLIKESEGAQVLSLKRHDLPETVLIRKDGASVYLLRDLAALKFRLQDWRADRVIYHIGIEQKLHLQQLFATAVELGWVPAADASSRLVAALHGHYRLPEGKMSSRKGRGVYLSDLIDQGLKLVDTVLTTKNPELTGAAKHRLAQDIAIGAIKYNDLSHNRESDIIFEWSRALNLEGNSALYLMYTYARLNGLSRKASTDGHSESAIEAALPLFGPEEKRLLMAVFQLHLAQTEATHKALPHLLADNLYFLAQTYNSFYGSAQIIDPSDSKKTGARLLLSRAVANRIAFSLGLLGIAAPEAL